MSLRSAIRLLAVTTMACAALFGAAAEQRARELLGGLPLRFEPNLGQWGGEVRFVSRSPYSTVLLTDDGAVVSAERGRAVRIRLAGSLPPASVQGLDALPSSTGYFLGNRPQEWKPRVPHYRRVRFEDVYPGVDVVYYGNGQQLEHDFVVAPGADPGRIRLEIEGADTVRIAADGSLAILSGDAEIRLTAPYAYQEKGPGERVEVPARFVKAGEFAARFELGPYDASRELVIDPVLMYSSFFSGTYLEEAYLVAVDAMGRIWIAGESASEDFPTNGIGLQPGGGGQRNAFLTVLDPFAGAGRGLVYSSYFGGRRDEGPTAMTFDAAGNVYLTGWTFSPDFPTTDNALEFATGTVSKNGFVVKFNIDADPKMLFSTYLGGDKIDLPLSLAVDSLERAYVAGFTDSEDFPMSGDTMQAFHRGDGDGFFSIIDTVQGGLVYSTHLGGTKGDWITALTIAAPGTVFVTGMTASDDFPIKGVPYRGKRSGGGDAFLTRIDWTKPGLEALGYSTYFGGSDLDEAKAILPAPDGGYYLLGYTLSEDLPVTAAAVQQTLGGSSDIFLAQLDPSRPGGEALLYSTYIGGSGGEVAYQMSADSAGGLVMAGYTLSEDFPIVGDYFDNTPNGNVDAFFLRLDPTAPNGTGLTCSSLIGGAERDVAWAVTVDSQDNMYIAGGTLSSDFPVTPNAFLRLHRAVNSAFVMKFGPCGAPTVSGTSVPRGERRIGPKGDTRPSRGGGRGR